MNRREILWHTLLAVLLTTGAAFGQSGDDPDVIVFYREGCHDCARMDSVLEEMHELYPSLSVRHIEESEPDGTLLWQLATVYGIFPTNFPVIFVGDEAISGVGLEKEIRLRTAVTACIREGCESPLARLSGHQIPWRSYLIAGLIALVLLLVFIDYAA